MFNKVQLKKKKRLESYESGTTKTNTHRQDGSLLQQYFDLEIIYISDLLLHMNMKDSIIQISNTCKIKKTNLFVWAGLHHSIPLLLRGRIHLKGSLKCKLQLPSKC